MVQVCPSADNDRLSLSLGPSFLLVFIRHKTTDHAVKGYHNCDASCLRIFRRLVNFSYSTGTALDARATVDYCDKLRISMPTVDV